MATQTTSNVMMIEPNYFRFNQEAASDNAYMMEDLTDQSSVVMDEFNKMVSSLESEGVTVHRFPSPNDCADAVWPNNWVVTLQNDQGKKMISLFPLKSPNRRLERNNEGVLCFLRDRYDCDLEKDWSVGNEDANRILEGTGSLILDRVNKICYAAMSARTDEALAKEWADYYGYQLVVFESEHNGNPVYHTNVILSIGVNFAVIAMDTVLSKYQNSLKESFTKTGKTIIEITNSQVSTFCGNILELSSNDSKRILAMSSQAYNGFTEEQKQQFFECGIDKIVHSDIQTLERIGGGSCRCMLAEIF